MRDVEPLEPRTLLAAAPAAAREFGGKVQGDLARLAQNLNRPLVPAALSRARTDSAGAIQLDLRVHGKMNRALSALTEIGAKVSALDEVSGVVEIWADPAMVSQISAHDSVTSISLPDYRVVRAGSVNTAGDALLNADKVRTHFAAYGINGSGVKVGVISGGVDHRNIVGADLSPITVDPSRPGSGDEGTAMLEIVHDLAPGAQLYFSGPQTAVEMSGAIDWLRSQGCGVIVDDLGFFDQPYFADGPLAIAVQNAVSAGVVYVSAAGNESAPVGESGSFH